ncbi:MAG TPA: DUF6502 family protein [Burkholderiaceae bacterium]|nr:DUF6502 family protein [Burkholderiaceae bacterium]
MTRPGAPPDAALQEALRAAFERVLAPLAQLAVARGVPFAAIDAILRAAFVAAAHAAHPGLPPHRRVSRVSATTGLNRREVTRLLAAEAERGEPVPPPRTPAAMVFAHWRSQPRWRTRSGAPRVLARSGPAPSFEALAQEVTRDVHPRALLEELLRLQLAVHDPVRDTVALTQDAFVPRGDDARKAGWLGANVGDHLAAAAANVQGRDPGHFEQAIAADGLTAEAVAQVRARLAAHWRQLTDELVPLLEEAVADAEARGHAAKPAHRLRIGLFSFDSTPAPAPAAATAPARASGARPKAATGRPPRKTTP